MSSLDRAILRSLFRVRRHPEERVESTIRTHRDYPGPLLPLLRCRRRSARRKNGFLSIRVIISATTLCILRYRRISVDKSLDTASVANRGFGVVEEVHLHLAWRNHWMLSFRQMVRAGVQQQGRCSAIRWSEPVELEISSGGF